jgi:hypothetical protein
MIGSSLQFTSFWVEKNLTEINHKVSLAARGVWREIAAAFAAKCATARHTARRGTNQAQGAVVQEAFIGNWAQESHLSAEHLNSMRDLNHRFLDLAGARAGDWAGAGRGGEAGLGLLVAPLTRSQRAAAANCPYALFDLRFEDDAHWQGRLSNTATWRVADDPKVDGDTIDFVRLALFYAWHLASGGGLACHLLMGMRSDTATAFRRMTVDRLPALVATEAVNLTARWSGCSAYWSALIAAAARADAAALRRIQLSGLQLAAAARLPSA